MRAVADDLRSALTAEAQAPSPFIPQSCVAPVARSITRIDSPRFAQRQGFDRACLVCYASKPFHIVRHRGYRCAIDKTARAGRPSKSYTGSKRFPRQTRMNFIPPNSLLAQLLGSSPFATAYSFNRTNHLCPTNNPIGLRSGKGIAISTRARASLQDSGL